MVGTAVGLQSVIPCSCPCTLVEAFSLACWEISEASRVEGICLKRSWPASPRPFRWYFFLRRTEGITFAEMAGHEHDQARLFRKLYKRHLKDSLGSRELWPRKHPRESRKRSGPKIQSL